MPPSTPGGTHVSLCGSPASAPTITHYGPVVGLYPGWNLDTLATKVYAGCSRKDSHERTHGCTHNPLRTVLPDRPARSACRGTHVRGCRLVAQTAPGAAAVAAALPPRCASAGEGAAGGHRRADTAGRCCAPDGARDPLGPAAAAGQRPQAARLLPPGAAPQQFDPVCRHALIRAGSGRLRHIDIWTPTLRRQGA